MDGDAAGSATDADAGASGTGSHTGTMHVVVQRCVRARLLVDAAADTWTDVARGLVVYVSFARGATDLDKGSERLLRQAAKSILSAPFSTSDKWTADHTDAESVVTLCKRGEEQGVLVVPQASLVAKLELGDKYLKYYQQCPKDTARHLFHKFVEALRIVARELIAGPPAKSPAVDYQELQAKRAAALQIPPEELFKTGEYADKYSRYDERGVPTHDAEGAELAKSAVKKLEKIYAGHVKKRSKAAIGSSDDVGAAPVADAVASAEQADEVAVAELPPLPQGAVLPAVRPGTFGGRQGLELTTGGPFTHMFVF